MANRCHDLVIKTAGVQITNKATVNLQQINVQRFQARVAGVAGTKVIDRHPTSQRLQMRQRLPCLLRVAERMVFR